MQTQERNSKAVGVESAKEHDSRSERFLVAFHAIEKYMKRKLALDRHMSFNGMINRLKKNDSVIAKYELDLKQYTRLRNAIVHEKVKSAFIIAEPHMDVVEHVEMIRDQLLAPEKVIPAFKRDVKFFETSDSLKDVLDSLKTYGYTQFPVFKDDKFVGILTESGISQWIVQNLTSVHEDTLMISSTATVGDVLRSEKHVRDVKFVDGEYSIYEVKQDFLKHHAQHMSRLEAVIITQDGKENGPLLGIITPCNVLFIN